MSNASDLWRRASGRLGFQVDVNMPVVMTAECSGADHTDEEWTTPVGAPAILTDIDARPNGGFAITTAIYCGHDPKDGGVKNIVNVFETTDPGGLSEQFPFEEATFAVQVMAMSPEGAHYRRPIHWSHADQTAADADGWWIADGDTLTIVADDEGQFAEPGEGGDHNKAIEHVTRLATNGDERATRAMLIHLQGCIDCWSSGLPMARPAGDENGPPANAQPTNSAIDRACDAVILALAKAGSAGVPRLVLATILGGISPEATEGLLARLLREGILREESGRYFLAKG